MVRKCFLLYFIYTKNKAQLFRFGHDLWLIAMLDVEFLNLNAFDPSLALLFDIFLLFLVILEMTIYTNINYLFYFCFNL